MICPNCGFSQPDDLYCANCGINIQKFLQKNKKKRYVQSVLVAVACLGLLLAAYRLHPDRSRPPERPPPQAPQNLTSALKARQASEKRNPGLPVQKSPPPPRKGASRAVPTEGQAMAEADAGLGAPSPPEAPPKEASSPGASISGANGSPEGPDKTEPSALQWFEKGLALDDDGMEPYHAVLC